jgi:hypothetical protein
MGDLIRIETHPGQPVTAHGVRLLPFAKRLIVRLPVFNLGLVWNRPVSILVTRSDGQEQVLPVRDPTRQIVWSLYGAIVMMVLLIGLINFTNSRR